MYRVRVIVFILLSFSLPVALFAQNQRPFETVRSFVGAVMEGSFEDAYSMLASDERDGVSFPQFESFIIATFPTADRLKPIQATYPTFYEFAIDNLYDLELSSGEIEKTEDDATIVRVRLSTIDLLTIAFEMSRYYPDISEKGVPDSEIDSIYGTALAELYGYSKPPRTDTHFLILVFEEEGRTVVEPGLRAMFDRMRAGDLAGDAWDASMSGRIEYAAMLYRDALGLDPSNRRYQQELEVVEIWLDGMRVDLSQTPTEYVMSYVRLDDIRVDMTGSPIFVCTVRNDGSEELRWIEIRIVYLDEERLLMDVEIVTHHFEPRPLGSRQRLAGVRIDSSEAPYGWTGTQFRLEVIDSGGLRDSSN